jgi:hypothetical protein
MITIRDLIDRRKMIALFVTFPLWLPGMGMAVWGGRPGPWTSVNCIGLGALLAAGAVYLACMGTIRCPACKKFIGLITVSPFRNKLIEGARCSNCGVSIDEPISAARDGLGR